MKSSPAKIPFEERVLYALLALVPVFFLRVTQECFEVPQSSLLATGALLILWSGLSSELGSLFHRSAEYASEAARRMGSAILGDPLGAAVLLYLASAAISTITAPNPAQSLYGAADSTAGLLTASSTTLVYFTARHSARGRPIALARMARAAGIASFVAAGYAVLQLLGLDPFVWGRTATYEGDVRVFGTLGHPNILGAYLGMTVPLDVLLFRRAKSGIERALWALLCALSVVVIAATLSRGAWIGLFAGGAAGALLYARARGRAGETAPASGPRSPERGQRRAAGLPVIAGTMLLALALAGFLFARSSMGAHLVERVRQIASLSAPTTQSRIQIWGAGLRMAGEHPWIGAGLDAFGTRFPRYRSPEYWRVEWGRTPNKAHNEGIQILATQGLVGGIAALLVVVLTAFAVLRVTGRGDPEARLCAVAAGAALAAFLVQDLASFTVVALGSLAAALAGWLSSAAWPRKAERREGEARGPKRANRPLWVRAVAAIPVLALFVFFVARPVRAQIQEKRALQAPDGSPARATELEAAARIAPWDARYRNFLGSTRYTQAERERDPERRKEFLRRAGEAYKSAIAIEPQSGYYWSNLGRVRALEAQLNLPGATLEEMRKLFREANARDPFNAELLDHHATALAQLGRVSEGRPFEVRILELYPNMAAPLGYLGYQALVERRWRDAADTLRIALTRDWAGEKRPHGTTWSNLSAAYLALGRNEDALRAAEEGLAVDPSNPDAPPNRTIALQRLGRPVPGAAGPGSGGVTR